MSLTIDAGLFRETLGHYPTGVAVVTGIAADGAPAGMVVGSFSSVSLDPPLVAFFPMRNSGSFAHLRTAESFCVNVLASDQEDLCRKFVTGKDSKFDGVDWRPSPLGAPILDGVVGWVDCTFEDIQDAGDHLYVVGRVHDLAVERSTLPLLFFQGGYGRFRPASLAAAPQPDLIQAAQLAEEIRGDVEAMSSRLGVNCSVMAKIGWDGVHVLSADRGPVPVSFPLGHRMPLVPPVGAVFMAGADEAEAEEWLARAPTADEDHDERYRRLLERVRAQGYSVLAAVPDVLQRHREVLESFEMTDRLPRQERIVQQVTADLIDLYEPDLVPGEEYAIETIVVPVERIAGYPPIAIRMMGLPQRATAEQIDGWIEELRQLASTAAAHLRRD